MAFCQKPLAFSLAPLRPCIRPTRPGLSTNFLEAGDAYPTPSRLPRLQSMLPRSFQPPQPVTQERIGGPRRLTASAQTSFAASTFHTPCYRLSSVRSMDDSKNVLGGKLELCGKDPVTGFFRNGCCDTSQEDAGMHVVCVVFTDEFLLFSQSRGNDLITPRPEWGFPGLKAGQRWCLCADRWREAPEAGMSPKCGSQRLTSACSTSSSSRNCPPTRSTSSDLVSGSGAARPRRRPRSPNSAFPSAPKS